MHAYEYNESIEKYGRIREAESGSTHCSKLRRWYDKLVGVDGLAVRTAKE